MNRLTFTKGDSSSASNSSLGWNFSNIVLNGKQIKYKRDTKETEKDITLGRGEEPDRLVASLEEYCHPHPKMQFCSVACRLPA